VPSPINPPSGCHFHTRCPYVMPVCKEIDPIFVDQGGGHFVACHLYPNSGADGVTTINRASTPVSAAAAPTEAASPGAVTTTATDSQSSEA
jgi:hypothetical protein